MRVALLTTGLTEFHGLPAALTALFPGHDFVAIEDRPGRPFHGFTSGRLPAPRIPNVLDTLIEKAIALVDPEANDPWSVVLMIEDLELANRDQPTVVCAEVVSAAVRHIAGLQRPPQATTLLIEAVRARLSFHLAVPMIESWFFASPPALTALGVEARCHWEAQDPEQFVSTDQAYAAAIPQACSEWCRRQMPKDDRPKWVQMNSADRMLHPKGYLQWLLIEPSHHTCTRYREGREGAAAVLEQLDWARVFRDPHAMPYARSLVRDLAEALGQAPAIGTWEGDAASLTCPKSTANTLRNL